MSHPPSRPPLTVARLLQQISLDLHALGQQQPRVHCITNSVAQHATANALLALGAQPAMTVDPDEVGEFIAAADALLVNLGTLDAARRAAIARALAVARAQAVPWVLDPVMVDIAPQRCRFARALLAERPWPTGLPVVRGNAREVAALALDAGITVAQTGAEDTVSDGHICVTIANGHPLMARVTAMGCIAAAVIAAFLALQREPLIAAVAGLATFGVAGELAGLEARGPGELQVRLLDQLYRLTPEQLQRHTRLTLTPCREETL